MGVGLEAQEIGLGAQQSRLEAHELQLGALHFRATVSAALSEYHTEINNCQYLVHVSS